MKKWWMNTKIVFGCTLLVFLIYKARTEDTSKRSEKHATVDAGTMDEGADR